AGGRRLPPPPRAPPPPVERKGSDARRREHRSEAYSEYAAARRAAPTKQMAPSAQPARIGRETARLKGQFGTTDECLPEPPATTTKTSSGDGTRGSRASGSVVAFIQCGQSCMPHMPPRRMRLSGWRAFS